MMCRTRIFIISGRFGHFGCKNLVKATCLQCSDAVYWALVRACSVCNEFAAYPLLLLL